MCDKTDIDKCVEEHLNIVHALVYRYKGLAKIENFFERGDENDLFQEGSIGLQNACEKFDPNRKNESDDEQPGAKFETFAYTCIKNALINRICTGSKNEKRIKIAIYDLTQKLKRPPSNKEIAAEAKIDIEIVEKFQNPRTISLEAPTSWFGKRTIEDILEIPEKEEGESESEITEKNVLFFSNLEVVFELSDLTLEEYLVVRSRWGIDQNIRPRPRKKAIEFWKDSVKNWEKSSETFKPSAFYTENENVVLETLQSLSGYETDKIRMIEFKATKKIAEGFRRWKQAATKN